MLVWTVQPISALEDIQNTGSFRCRKELSYNLSKKNSLKRSYEWLNTQMTRRIGPKPKGVEYPVWAWHTWENNRQCPDPDSAAFLQREEDKVLLTLDIPERDLVLTDFDAWQIVMMDGYLMSPEQIENQDELEEHLASLSEDDYRMEVEDSWQRVFDTAPAVQDGLQRGQYVQATFWEIKKEYVVRSSLLPANQKVRFLHG